jgi:hypothetical protein
MWGAGLIVYWLVPPFDDYADDRSTSQHFEWGRDPTDTWWVTEVQVEDANSLRFAVEEGIHAGITVCS